MRKSKKLILIAVLIAVVLVGSISGVVLAQKGSTTDGSVKTLMARVAAILGIDQQKLEDAFAQAQREMKSEALDNYLKNLVDQGKITLEQADQYRSWLQSRPDMPTGSGLNLDGRFCGKGGMRGFGKMYAPAK